MLLPSPATKLAALRPAGVVTTVMAATLSPASGPLNVKSIQLLVAEVLPGVEAVIMPPKPALAIAVLIFRR